MNLDSRLQAIKNFVPLNSRVVDVGTDHGYLAIELIESSVADFVIASDKNTGPLEAARKNIDAVKLNDKIELRIGDGLQKIAVGEINVICIAGIGGALICDILNAAPEVVKSVDKIILQPMNAVEKVRQWIITNHLNIEDEDLAEVDDIIYEIICVSKKYSTSKITKKDKSPLLSKFINNKIYRLQRVIEEMSKSPKAMMSSKYLEIQNQIKQLKAELK